MHILLKQECPAELNIEQTNKECRTEEGGKFIAGKSVTLKGKENPGL
jgi:hypothetical protein